MALKVLGASPGSLDLVWTDIGALGALCLARVAVLRPESWKLLTEASREPAKLVHASLEQYEEVSLEPGVKRERLGELILGALFLRRRKGRIGQTHQTHQQLEMLTLLERLWVPRIPAGELLRSSRAGVAV